MKHEAIGSELELARQLAGGTVKKSGFKAALMMAILRTRMWFRIGEHVMNEISARYGENEENKGKRDD